jgi:hypothetical protein
VAVTPSDSISFRYNYVINGRQETITFGRFGSHGISLAQAREQLTDAKRMVVAGKSPAKEKTRQKARLKSEGTFGSWADRHPHRTPLCHLTASRWRDSPCASSHALTVCAHKAVQWRSWMSPAHRQRGVRA